jgi:hypothetical protein
LVPAVILLGASYIVSRALEHYSIGGFSHVLEIVGAYWVGAFFLLFSIFLALDLRTGFGLWAPSGVACAVDFCYVLSWNEIGLGLDAS